MSASPLIQDRQKDERDLFILQLWDEEWTVREIAKLVGVHYGCITAQVDRVDQADPTALRRKPQRRAA